MKKIKRLLASFMVVAMLLTTAPLSGFVGLELPNISDIFASAYIASGSFGNNLTWTFYESTGELEIDGAGAINIYCPWKSFEEPIKIVVIGDSITAIGDNAFYGCNELTRVTIGNSVTTIGAAFSYCNSLTDVYYNGTEEEWNKIAIDDRNEPLYNAMIHYNYLKDGNTSGNCGENLTWAFEADMGKLTISGKGKMYDYAYNDTCPWDLFRTSIKSITIDDGVTSVGNYAFNNYRNLESLKIGDSVESINYCTFENCNKLTTIAIPASVKRIDHSSFSLCPNITNFVVDEGNSVYSSDECGVLFDKEKTIVIRYPCNNSRTNYTIPDSVTSIGNSAFSGCVNLKNIVIPGGVTEISAFAFTSCSGLTSMVIPDGVISIGYSAFSYCYNITEITIPDSVTDIDDYVFNECIGLADVYYKGTEDEWSDIPIGTGNENLFNATIHFNESDDIYLGACGDNLKCKFNPSTGKLTIYGTGDMYNYDCVFDNQNPMHSSSPWGLYMPGILSVTISEGVTSIGEYAFLYASTFSGLTSVTIPDSVTSIGDSAFECCSKLTSITIPESVTSIGDGAFNGCSNLTSVTIPNNVTSIGNSVFNSCDSLTSVVIPNSVKTIGNYTFAGCHSLTSVTIPDSVTSIGDSAFECCSKLTSITIPDSVTSIGEWTFAYCYGLTSVTISDSVTTIGDCVFYDCVSLTSIEVDADNEYYSSDSYGVLYNKTKTELIQYPVGNKRVKYVIPDSVTIVGDAAFQSCSNLTSITISESVTSLGSGSFSWCDKLVDIKISPNLTHIGSYAFSATGYSQNLSNWENGLLYVGEFLVSCQERENILVKDGTKLIADEVFLYHESMISITLPESLRYIGSYAFYCCNSLNDVYYSGTQKQWNSISVDTNNECLTNANIHYEFEPVSSAYTITFNANGGLNAPAAQMKTYGIDLILSKTTPTKSGYVFLGWSTNKNATVAQYQAGDVFSTDADITLYAVWVAKNIYNLGEETYSFSNFGDSDSQGGHCFGMSMTSSGYYLGELDVTDIGIDISSKLYTVSKTTSVKKPICYYQGIQGYYATNATVAGGTYYKYGYYDINSDWNDVINYVKSHKYDDTGAFQIGYRKNGQGGHAINFLRYENVDGQDRIYVYDNNFPDTETYFCKGTDGKIYQKPYSTFSGAIDCIALRNVYDYFELAKDFDVSRVIYAKADTIEIEGVTAYPMELDGSEEYMMYEIPEDVDSIIIVPLDDYVTFEYMEETYEFRTVSDDTYGVFTLSTTEETKDESFIIENAGTDTSNMCGDNLYWSFDEETGHLIISGTGDMYNYDYGKSPWYNSDLSIKKVTINNGVTSIGAYAFDECTSLADVYYNGTEDEWNGMLIGTGNDDLLNATIHFQPSPSVVLGDPTGDNKINSTDALLCLQHSVGKIKLEGDTFTVADVDKNGFVNSSDALKILQFSVGKIDKL